MTNSTQPQLFTRDNLCPHPYIYMGNCVDDPDTDFDQMVVITSDLPRKNDVLPMLADRVIEWYDFNHSRALITIESLNREDLDDQTEIIVFNVVSNQQTADFLEGLQTPHLTNDMVSGLSGLLPYKANIASFLQISFLAEANPNFPASKSAASILSVLNKLVPKISIDYDPLLKELEKVEAQFQKALSQIRQQPDKFPTPPSSSFFA